MKGIKFKKNNEQYYPDTRYEVGDLYITTRSENPSTRFGGTWELYGPGRTMVCVDVNNTNFNTVGKTGGNAAHYHTTGNHTLTVDEMPSHTHTVYRGTEGNSYFGLTGKESTATPPYAIATTSAGGGGAHGHGNTGDAPNYQPFITCYVWIRTA